LDAPILPLLKFLRRGEADPKETFWGLTSPLLPSDRSVPALRSGVEACGGCEGSELAMTGCLGRARNLGLSGLRGGTGIEKPEIPARLAVGDSSKLIPSGVLENGRSKEARSRGVIAPRREMLEGLRIWDQPEVRYEDGPGDAGVILLRDRTGVV
jgi:hypothetical protein